MEKILEIYQQCDFNNKNILEVTNNILNIVSSAKISKNEDNEIVISYKKDKNQIILLVDKFADVQFIKSTENNYIYKVYYFSEGIDYNKLIRGL